VIDVSGGKLAGSKLGEAGESVAGVATVGFKPPDSASIDLGSGDEPSGSTGLEDSRFIRDQRDMMFSTRVIAVLPVLAAVARHLRLTSVPLPFGEGSLDVMLKDKTIDCLDNRRRHRYGRD
jgi:hypothetical protein